MLTPLEIAAGSPLPDRMRGRPAATTLTPAAALDAAVLAAVRRTPCVVSFSGGRDSSLVLSVAVAAARREGLPLPVPLTVRVRGDADAEERGWQELVVRRLGVEEWERVELDQEFDCVGPLAQDVLRRHGVLWPPNAHFHLPQLRAARGGALLTGVGGDEMFSESGWLRLHDVAAGRARPEPRDVLRLAAAAVPWAVRMGPAIRRAQQLEFDWVRPRARRAVVRAFAETGAAEPVRWSRRFGWLLGLRYLRLGARSLDLLAADHDVAVHQPFLDPAFVGSLAALQRGRRFRGRTEALLTLFAHLLPREVATRSSKAGFSAALWGEESRALAAAWDGEGVDPDIVDVDALKRRWRREGRPGPHVLLQSIWLGTVAPQPAVTPSTASTTSGTALHDRGRLTSHAGIAAS